jgi:hypothetical protein
MIKESIFKKILRWLGIIKETSVSKKEMCLSAKGICNKSCDSCAWNEEEQNDKRRSN